MIGPAIKGFSALGKKMSKKATARMDDLDFAAKQRAGGIQERADAAEKALDLRRAQASAVGSPDSVRGIANAFKPAPGTVDAALSLGKKVGSATLKALPVVGALNDAGSAVKSLSEGDAMGAFKSAALLPSNFLLGGLGRVGAEVLDRGVRGALGLDESGGTTFDPQIQAAVDAHKAKHAQPATGAVTTSPAAEPAAPKLTGLARARAGVDTAIDNVIGGYSSSNYTPSDAVANDTTGLGGMVALASLAPQRLALAKASRDYKMEQDQATQDTATAKLGLDRQQNALAALEKESMFTTRDKDGKAIPDEAANTMYRRSVKSLGGNLTPDQRNIAANNAKMVSSMMSNDSDFESGDANVQLDPKFDQGQKASIWDAARHKGVTLGDWWDNETVYGVKSNDGRKNTRVFSRRAMTDKDQSAGTYLDNLVSATQREAGLSRAK